MSITQEAANLIDTLAHAASQIGSTAASAKINQLIVSLIPSTDDSAEAIAEALRQDNAALQLELAGTQKSAVIMAENLALLRERMEQINTTATEILSFAEKAIDDVSLDDLRRIIDLSNDVGV